MRIVALLIISLGLYAQILHVAASANVSGAISDIAKAFEKRHKGVKVEIALGSSGKLFAQIKSGAPYAIFLSANERYVDLLYKEGIIKSKPVIYAKGSLALFSSKGLDPKQGVGLLSSPAVKRIAIANPKMAPYGAAAKEALDSLHLYKRLRKKFIYANSIAQTLTYALQVADVAIVAKSSLLTTKMRHYREFEHWIELDASLYSPIKQAMGLIDANNSVASGFFAFMQSDEAKSILQRYGYALP